MQLEHLTTALESVAHLGPIETRFAPANLRTELADVVHDSRRAAPNTLFCAVPGLTVDGHDYVDAAVSNGAAAVLVERFLETDCPQIKVDSVRAAMAHAASLVHNLPSSQIAVFGITGTNGKTTTTQLVAGIVHAAGQQCEVIGTLGGVHTTPESPSLQRELRAFVDQGVQVVALEVSSHALDQRRVDATEFSVVAFSNLTPDHLDYHHDMESYFEAKSRLFDGRAHHELINIDDAWGERLASLRPEAITVSLNDIEILSETIVGTRFRWRGHETWVPLPGRMNVANALMAAEAARLLGLAEAVVAGGLAQSIPVPGRMEVVMEISDDRPTVVVDYSHTPDSIERALATLRSVSPQSSLSIVFGCGGDRDRQKRPLMSKAAQAGADKVYLTSDNPRSEDPLAIIADAMVGFDEPNQIVVEADRKIAIERAIIDADPGDVVLIAGKGHEKTQTIGSDVLPFDDVRVAHDSLKAATT